MFNIYQGSNWRLRERKRNAWPEWNRDRDGKLVALFDPLDRSFSIYSLFFVRINERARRLSRMIRIFDEGFIEIYWEKFGDWCIYKYSGGGWITRVIRIFDRVESLFRVEICRACARFSFLFLYQILSRDDGFKRIAKSLCLTSFQFLNGLQLNSLSKKRLVNGADKTSKQF